MGHPVVIQETPDNTLGNVKGSGISFGNFGTQVCGALQMALVEAQKDIAYTGAELMTALTQDTIGSYQSQSTLMNASFNQAIDSAEKQFDQMKTAAIGEWGSAGISLVSGASSLGIAKWSEAGQQLENETQKLSQQRKLMDTLQSTTPKPASLTAAEEGQEMDEMDVATKKGILIESRMNKLLTEGGANPLHLNEGEKSLYKQKPFNPGKGNYYNDDPNEEDVARGYKTKGAYYIEDLDEAAVRRMNSDQRTKAIAKVDEQIRATETRQNSLNSTLQRNTTNLDMLNNGVRNIASGTSQFIQGGYSQQAKKDEAGSTVGNQGANVAGSVTQGFMGTIKGIEQQTEGGMSAFGRVFDNMRG